LATSPLYPNRVNLFYIRVGTNAEKGGKQPLRCLPFLCSRRDSSCSCQALLLTDSSGLLLLHSVNDTALLGTPHTRDSGGVIIVVAWRPDEVNFWQQYVPPRAAVRGGCASEEGQFCLTR